jgi:hypothetical protein
MFLQVCHGQGVSEPEEAHTSLGRWMDSLAGGDTGWLGTTAGVTDDGESFTLTQFDSAGSAGRAATTPARERWWAELSALCSGPLTVEDCGQVITQLRGDSDEAGFVQVLQGRITNLERLERALEAASPWQAETRSDIIGGLLALHGGGRFTQTVYFTSEAEARNGERIEPPPGTAELAFLVDDLTYWDLRRPWGYSAW